MVQRFPILALLALALTLIALGIVSSGNAADAAATADVIPGQYIVVFNDNVADPGAVASDVAQEHGLSRRHTYSFALKGFAASIPGGRLNAVANDPRVAYVESDLEAQALLHGNDFQTLPTGVDRIDADLNATANIDGVDDVDDRVDVDIAIIDTGIDLDHPDLNVFQNKSFIKGASTGDDDNGHGSHVAGTAAAVDNDIGVVGVAPGARLWALKVLDENGSGSFADVIAGIDHVTANATDIEVANMSLGGVGKLDSMRTAIQNSVAAGVVYVVAAGNSAMDVYGDDGTFETSDDFIPAAYPEVAAISAMVDTDGQSGGTGGATFYGADDTLASFSNFSNSVVAGNPVTSSGAAVDIAAPGVDITSTWTGGLYAITSGTSMASPHAAGAASLEAAINGRAVDADGVAAIRQALIDGAEAMADWRPAPDTLDTDSDPDANHEPLVDAGAIAPAAPDTTGPTVTAVDPADAATDVAVTTNITVTFSEPVDPATVTSSTFTITDGGAVAGTITVAGDGPSATFNPGADLANSTTYTVIVTSGVTDTSGNALDQDGDPDNGNQDFTSSFTTAAPDVTPPVISNVTATDITDASATITWTTDEDSDSVVNFGTTTSLGSTQSDSTLTTSHSVALTGLTPETAYFYEVKSTDGSANTATDDNGGVFYSFTTAAAAPWGTITGIITDASTLPIEGATVRLKGGFKAITDADGNYTISNVPVGTYTVRARAKGFSSATQEVTVVAGEIATADFILTPK